jgi:hypothetical protein
MIVDVDTIEPATEIDHDYEFWDDTGISYMFTRLHGRAEHHPKPHLPLVASRNGVCRAARCPTRDHRRLHLPLTPGI